VGHIDLFRRGGLFAGSLLAGGGGGLLSFAPTTEAERVQDKDLEVVSGN
jgi:hypothetical protein